MSSLSKSVHNQGIGSVLGYDNTKAGSSLRRTLSADMSSKKWQSQNGIFSRIRKVASSQELTFGHGFCSIQEEKNWIDKEPVQFDIWSSILSQKAKEEASNLPPPYVHPLVKRSSSSLSEKSLQICTESLGSETGSDGCFSSSYPAAESSDVDSDDNKEEELIQEKSYEFEGDVRSVNVMYKTKRMSPRSFPPPIPSLSCRDGTSVRVNSYRDNGRLVLEAVSVLSQNNFRASRQDGRLVLTFVDSPDGEEEEEEEEQDVQHEQFEMEFERSEAAEEAPDETEDVDEEKAERFSGGKINFLRIAMMVNKNMVQANTNTTCFDKFVKMANFEAEEEEDEEEESGVEATKQLTQSLPMRASVVPRVIPSSTSAATATAVVSLNPYEYYWKPKSTTTTSILNPIKDNKLILSKSMVATNNQQINQLLELKGLRSCKEPRMSLLFWEPHCIATS